MRCISVSSFMTGVGAPDVDERFDDGDGSGLLGEKGLFRSVAKRVFDLAMFLLECFLGVTRAMPENSATVGWSLTPSVPWKTSCCRVSRVAFFWKLRVRLLKDDEVEDFEVEATDDDDNRGTKLGTTQEPRQISSQSHVQSAAWVHVLLSWSWMSGADCDIDKC